MMNIVNDEKLNIEKTILHHKEGVDLIPANIELSAIDDFVYWDSWHLIFFAKLIKATDNSPKQC